MKLYTSKAPNPIRVNVFVAEKGLSIPTEVVDIMGGETRTDAFGAINTLYELPVLELDDGFRLTESLAICSYLESLAPSPILLGSNALEQAKIQMWARRIERQIFDKAGHFGIHTFPLFADRVEQIPAYAQSLIPALDQSFRWLDAELSDGRTYLSDDEFSLADVVGMSALFILTFAALDIPDGLTHVQRWREALVARDSWTQCIAG